MFNRTPVFISLSASLSLSLFLSLSLSLHSMRYHLEQVVSHFPFTRRRVHEPIYKSGAIFQWKPRYTPTRRLFRKLGNCNNLSTSGIRERQWRERVASCTSYSFSLEGSLSRKMKRNNGDEQCLRKQVWIIQARGGAKRTTENLMQARGDLFPCVEQIWPFLNF